MSLPSLFSFIEFILSSFTLFKLYIFDRKVDLFEDWMIQAIENYYKRVYDLKAAFEGPKIRPEVYAIQVYNQMIHVFNMTMVQKILLYYGLTPSMATPVDTILSNNSQSKSPVRKWRPKGSLDTKKSNKLPTSPLKPLRNDIHYETRDKRHNATKKFKRLADSKLVFLQGADIPPAQDIKQSSHLINTRLAKIIASKLTRPLELTNVGPLKSFVYFKQFLLSSFQKIYFSFFFLSTSVPH